MIKFTPSGYLMHAHAANQYTKQKMIYGSSNDLSKITGPVRFIQNIGIGLVNTMARSEADRDIDTLRVADFDTRRQMEIWAEKAEKYGAGNCGEQSAIAFSSLRRRGVEPLTWARWSIGNHAFVILGKPRDGTAKNFADWAGTGVICDPWKGKVGFLRDLPNYPLTNMTFMLHAEDGVVL